MKRSPYLSVVSTILLPKVSPDWLRERVYHTIATESVPFRGKIEQNLDSSRMRATESLPQRFVTQGFGKWSAAGSNCRHRDSWPRTRLQLPPPTAFDVRWPRQCASAQPRVPVIVTLLTRTARTRTTPSNVLFSTCTGLPRTAPRHG